MLRVVVVVVVNNYSYHVGLTPLLSSCHYLAGQPVIRPKIHLTLTHHAHVLSAHPNTRTRLCGRQVLSARPLLKMLVQSQRDAIRQLRTARITLCSSYVFGCVDLHSSFTIYCSCCPPSCTIFRPQERQCSPVELMIVTLNQCLTVLPLHDARLQVL